MNDVTAAPERWLPVVGYEGYYEVSSLGRVRSLPRLVVTNGRGTRLFPGVMLKFGTYKKTGHKHVTFAVARKNRTFTVHSVVLAAFIGPRPDGLEIRHLNGVPDDNRLSNLAYGTALENAEDRDERHGTNHELNVTECPQGHKYTEANTYVTPNGWRQCRTCRDGGRPAPECCEDGCSKSAKSRKRCATHYARWRRANMTEEQREKIRAKDTAAGREKRKRLREDASSAA